MMLPGDGLDPASTLAQAKDNAPGPVKAIRAGASIDTLQLASPPTLRRGSASRNLIGAN